MYIRFELEEVDISGDICTVLRRHSMELDDYMVLLRGYKNPFGRVINLKSMYQVRRFVEWGLVYEDAMLRNNGVVETWYYITLLGQISIRANEVGEWTRGNGKSDVTNEHGLL